MKARDMVPPALFLLSVLAMFLVDGKYPYVYAAGAAAIVIAMYFRITLIAQVAGLAVLLVFTSTSYPTLPDILLAIGILSAFIYGGNALGGIAWQTGEQAFEITERKGAGIAYAMELGRVAVPAALLTIVTAVIAGGVGVKADNVLIFIFMISLGLLLLGLISRHVSSQ